MLKNTGARKLLGYPVCNRNLCRCSNVVTKVTKFSRRRVPSHISYFFRVPTPLLIFFKMTDLDLEDSSRQSISRSCAPVVLWLNFFPDKSNFLILFGIIVGARAPASAPAFFGVALRLALRGNFRSCAPTALRLLGAPLRSAVPRSAAFQWSVDK